MIADTSYDPSTRVSELLPGLTAGGVRRENALEWQAWQLGETALWFHIWFLAAAVPTSSKAGAPSPLHLGATQTTGYWIAAIGVTDR